MKRLVILVLVSLSYLEGSGADEFDLDELKEFDFQPLSFSSEPNHSLAYIDPAKIELDPIVLNHDTMSEKERSYWDRLLHIDTPLADQVLLMRKISSLHKGQNFEYQGISSILIDTLLKMANMSISHCTRAGALVIRGIKRNPNIQRHESLKCFMEYHRDRILKVCYGLHQDIVKSYRAQIHDGSEMGFNNIHTSMAKLGYPITKIAASFPQDNFFVDTLARSIAESPVGKKILSFRIRRPSLNYLSFLDLRRKLKSKYGLMCRNTSKYITELIKYFDASAEEEERPNLILMINRQTRIAMGVGRFCHIIYFDHATTEAVWKRVAEILGVPLGDPPEGSTSTSHDEQISSDLSAIDDLADEDDLDNEDLDDADGAHFPAQYQLKVLRDLNLLLEGRGPRPMAHVLVKFNRVRKYYEEMRLLPSSLLGEFFLTEQDLNTINNFLPYKIENCTIEKMIERLRLLDSDTFKNVHGIRYYSRLSQRYQVTTCWNVFDVMLEERIGLLHPETIYRMAQLHLPPAPVEFNMFITGLARQMVKEESVQAILNEGNHEPDQLIEPIITAVKEIFGPHCLLTAEALGDYIDYGEFFRQFELKRPSGLKEFHKNWLDYGRLCRSFFDSQFLNRVAQSIIDRAKAGTSTDALDISAVTPDDTRTN